MTIIGFHGRTEKTEFCQYSKSNWLKSLDEETSIYGSAEVAFYFILNVLNLIKYFKTIVPSGLDKTYKIALCSRILMSENSFLSHFHIM